MISKDRAEKCLKENIIDGCLEYIEAYLRDACCLPPDEIPPGKYSNPKEQLMGSIKRQLKDLYDDAQKVARIDLESLNHKL